MKRIDLHNHTTASDGTLTPAEAVVHARLLGLDAIAVTDHDTPAGLPEALDAGQAVGVEVIPGIEVSVDWQGRGIHILGYFIDPAAPSLRHLLNWVVAERRRRNEAIAALFREDGIDLSGYQKMVVTLVRTPGKNTFIRIYDSGSLFGDYWQFDLGGLKEKEIDLHDIKKASGEPIDPSHIRFVGFSAGSDVTLYVKDVQLVKESTAIETIQSDAASEKEYYLDLMGRPVTNPTHGIYIVNGKKVFIP